MMVQYSVNAEDKVCACHSISNLCSEEEARTKIVERKFVRMVAPLLLDSDPVLVSAALGCLYNLSCQGDHTVHHIVRQDVLTPLLSLMSQFSGILCVQDKIKRAQSEKIMEDSFNLARNILQENDDSLESFTSSPVFSHLTPMMTVRMSPRVWVSLLQLLATVCDDNIRAQEALAPHLDCLASLAASQETSLGVRTAAALVLVTASRDRQSIMSDQVCGITEQTQ